MTATQLGIIFRWMLTALLVFYVFKEQPGTATRIFVVLVTIAMEMVSLHMNLENIKKRDIDNMVQALEKGAEIRRKAAKK